jgi:ribosomal protein S18 acetylase RimI-like enzyme
MAAIAIDPFEGSAGTRFRIVEIEDERSPLAREALSLLRSAFPPPERQPIEQIAMEIAEKRLGLLTSYDFHLFASLSGEGRVMAIASGVYLGGVNAGFVTYLAVGEEYRSQRIGRALRTSLIDAFRQDARALDWLELASVIGEVRQDSPWLERLIRERSAIPFDFTYYHPGQEPEPGAVRWVLYRQPIGDRRENLPYREVRQLLYAIWRRATGCAGRWSARRSAPCSPSCTNKAHPFILPRPVEHRSGRVRAPARSALRRQRSTPASLALFPAIGQIVRIGECTISHRGWGAWR